jgi:Tol biopolymer transport system component
VQLTVGGGFGVQLNKVDMNSVQAAWTVVGQRTWRCTPVRVIAPLMAVLCAYVVFAPLANAAFPGRDGVIALLDDEGTTPGNCPGDPACTAPPNVSLISPSGRSLGQVDTSLCTDGPWDCDPSWSPDGTELAYDATAEGDSYAVGRVAIARIGQPTTLLPPLPGRGYGAISPVAPVFSPDGRQLLLTWNGRLWRERIDGSDLAEIPLPHMRHPTWPVWPATPAWSSRGLIAFVYRDNIYLVRPNGRGLRQLTYHGGLDPSFSPDGKKLAFVRARVNAGDTELGSGPIDLIDVDGRHLRRMPGLARICPCAGPAWSPSGRKIAFISDTTNCNASLSNSLYTVDVKGHHRHRLLTAGQYGTLGAPDWQPLPTSRG